MKNGPASATPFFQAKLTVNTPGDAHEQEADAVADQVMRMKTGDAPVVQRTTLTPVSSVQRACAACEQEREQEKEGIQRKETSGGDASSKAAPSVVSDVLSSGGGQPMDGGTKQFMESRFGQDFSQVRIHTDSRAAESASAIQTRAYTSGRDVVFGNGEYQPSSEGGRRLLAHELVHVGQQGGGEGSVQRFQISAAQQRRFPMFTRFIKNEIPKSSNDGRVVASLNTFGTNQGATRRDIATDTSWGNGPTLKITNLTGAFGEFSPGINSQEIRIDRDAVKAYERAILANTKRDHELFLEATVLHEYTHYLDDQDGVDRAGEEGEGFETATYGKVLGSRRDAGTLFDTRFRGDWTVNVEGLEAGFSQRFRITGAQAGNGNHPGQVGQSVRVQGKGNRKWRIIIEHNDGKNGWQASKTIKVNEGVDNFLLRSEDWTDRDRNDLTIRVKK